VNVTVYVPGCRLSMRYWPLSSVVAARVFSISTGLEASTVTPGRMRPEASLTVPARATWAHAAEGINTRAVRTADTFAVTRISPPRWFEEPCGRPRRRILRAGPVPRSGCQE